MLLLLFTAVLVQYVVCQQEGLTVNITQGEIFGAKASDGSYYTFYGIHYGGNTAGQNRFKAPTPPPPYPGKYNAHDSTVLCAQPSSRGLIGTEDCLTLSVFTNATTPSKPVLVWLVGEEYQNTEQLGTTFKKLVLEGVVVVQMNYRLSIFGFLCLGVAEAPGNAGLRDVVQGLKWINQNIAPFGGDPNNVILFGHGSGAAMVDLITLSPQGKDLFHKAIAQSGSALAPWAVSYTPVAYAQAVGEKLGYTKKTNEELARLFVTTDITLLANTLTEFEFFNNTILFAPCVENSALNDTFLADAPLNILRSGNYSDVPYIAGFTDREGTLRAEQAAYRKWLDLMQTNFTNFLPADLYFGTNATVAERAIRDFYFGSRTINMESITNFLDYQGDTLILVAVVRAARERALTSKSQVRLMEFAFKGTLNSDWTITTIPNDGARHGSVLNFLLNHDLRTQDEPVMTSLVRRFVTFFNSGTPNPTGTPAWEPVTASSLKYLLYAGSDVPLPNNAIFIEESRENPHTQRMTLWNDLYFKYYVAPKPVTSGTGAMSATFVVVLSMLLNKLFSF